jgi:hypothetical protein
MDEHRQLAKFLLGCFYEKEDGYAKQDDEAAFNLQKESVLFAALQFEVRRSLE